MGLQGLAMSKILQHIIRPRMCLVSYEVFYKGSCLYFDSKVTEEMLAEVVTSCGHLLLAALNCMLLLLNFSGWRDARIENSQKTSPAIGNTEVKKGLVAVRATVGHCEPLQ